MTRKAEARENESAREMIAAEVRAELGRRKLNSNNLPEYIGKSQSYWYNRIHANIAFSSDDLGLLSWMLDVPMADLLPKVVAPLDPGTKNGPAASATGPRKLVPVGPTGIEPMTSTVELPRFAPEHEAIVTPMFGSAVAS